MKEMTFTELQQMMQLEKKQERNAKYASRSAEDIYNTFKSLKSSWGVIVDYDLVVVMDKTYIKATATAFSKEAKVESVAFAELSPVPILKTRNGDLKQMTEPQWTGAVQSYAGKYALQSLFAIGDQDVDQLEVALITGQSVETVANYYLKKYKLNDFHELLVPGFDVVTNDIQTQINNRKG